MEHDEYNRVFFSIIANNYYIDPDTVHSAIDDIVLLLPRLRAC
jgi:hypothetical protein